MLNIADAGIIQRIAGAISTALQASTTKDRLRVVLQIGKKHLAQAFQLTARLRQHFTEANVEFYTLYDSMKKSCCTDIIGSRHIEPYALLFHFGYACFSEHQDSRHHYILPQIDEDSWHNFEKVLLGQEFAEMVGSEKIGAILCDQSVYEQVLSIEQ